MVLLILVLLIAGCSQGQPAPASDVAPTAAGAPTEPTTESGKTSEPTAAPTTAPTAAVAPTTEATPDEGTPSSEAGPPQYGGIMTVAQPFGPITLDPMIDPGADGIYILEQVMEGLMRIYEDGSIGPGLAESWEISDDQLVWSFKLREGVKFQNGDPFTADDVIFTFNRLMDPDGVASFKALYIDHIEKVEKVDDFNVKITMKAPWPAFPVFASTNHTKILNQRNVEEAGDQFGFTIMPVGTGFFKLDRWDKDDQVVLVKNEDYWQEGLPYLDGIVYKLVKDSQVAKLSITTGQVDVLQDPPVDQLPELQKNPDVKVLSAPGGAQMLIDVNLDKPPFDDVRVRKAISMAIDRQQIVDVVFYGTAEVANDFFPSWFWADNPDFEIPYDPERAKALLAEAGYGPDNPLKFTLFVYNFIPYTDIGQIVQAQLAQIGVQMDVQAFDSATAISYMNKPEKRPQMEAVLFRHIARANHYEFSGNRYSANGKLNWSGYNKGSKVQNPHAQELFDQVEPLQDFDEGDQEKARPIYDELAQIVLVDDVVQIMLVHQANVDVVRNRVQGYPSSAYDWQPYWKTWLSQK